MPVPDHVPLPRPPHPLASLILDAAAGRFPSADGRWRRLPPWLPGLEAVVAFTAHAVVCVEDDVEDIVLDQLVGRRGSIRR